MACIHAVEARKDTSMLLCHHWVPERFQFRCACLEQLGVFCMQFACATREAAAMLVCCAGGGFGLDTRSLGLAGLGLGLACLADH